MDKIIVPVLCNRLLRLIPKTRRPRATTRRIICAVVHSIIFYGALAWSSVTGFGKYQKIVDGCIRRAKIGVAGAYRTVSSNALDVIAGISPILLVEERAAVYRGMTKSDAKEATLRKWQTEWEKSLTGAWTVRLISDIKKWVSRKQGEINFYITQFLSGHGVFSSYLYKIQKVENDKC